MKRFFALVLFVCLVFSPAFAAEDTVKLKTLGQSPLTPPILDATTAKQVVKNYAEEIRKLENDGLFSALKEQLGRTNLEKGFIPVGATVRWMLFGSKNGTVRSVRNIEWAGQEPIQGFGFEIIYNKMIYYFFVPKTCGNICLSQIRKQPEETVAPPTPPQTQEPPKPAEPKTVTPVVVIPPPVLISPQPAPTQTSAKKHHPDFKLKFGPWIPWEPMTFSANQHPDRSYNFNDYLPAYVKFLTCADSERSTIFLEDKNFIYRTGDSVLLKQQRSMQTSWSGIQFNVGAEVRIWKNLWLGADYYQSRVLKVNISKYAENMYFKNVEYLGYYSAADESLISCPPKYHRYCLDLNRRTSEQQTEYTIMSREIHLLLRYYLNIGRFSLAPAFGLADQQFLIKTRDNTVSTVLYPWKDKIIEQSESSFSSTRKDNYQLTWTAGLTGEVKLFKFLSIAVEGSYQKFHKEDFGMDFSFKSKPWRATATLKILF